MRRQTFAPARRSFVAGALAAACVGSATAAQSVGVFVISRKRLLTESKPTKILREAEIGITARLQAEIDRVKSALAAEEADLTRRRDEIPPEEMLRLATDFDRRVRKVRVLTQERAKAVQSAFQEARAKLVLELPPILEKLRLEVGAVAILDADQILAIDPENDLTDRAISMLNEALPAPDVPEVDVSLTIATKPETTTGQD